jgi:chemotaxis protein methyltransferase CheR
MDQLLSDGDFERFRAIINKESGIHFCDANRSILESRLRERLRTAKLENLSAYYDLIRRDADELKILLDSVTTNLTRFFRNQAHFEALEHDVVPDLVNWKRSTGVSRIRVWSAGCSTGEEPYSVAMLLSELLPRGFDYEVVASDLSLKSLMTAREGFYLDTRMQGVTERYRERYFRRQGDGYVVGDEIKAKVRFDYHNLKFDSGLRDLDLVLCRNVIIYFDDTAKRAVVEKFWESLNGHSYLFIGHSESLFGMNSKFTFAKTDHATFYVKMTAKPGGAA